MSSWSDLKKYTTAVAAMVLVVPATLWTGTIKGKITTIEKKSRTRRVAKRYAGKHSQPAGKLEPIPALVILMGKVPGFPIKKTSGKLEMVQNNFAFKPGLLIVPINSTVEFPNEDKEFHNVFSYSRIKRFDLGRYHQGESKSVTFNKPGIGKIYCEIHEWMRAVIAVVENPFYGVADEKGNYIIKNIPKGKYQLLIWKIDHKRSIQEVEIPQQGTMELNFSLPHQNPRKSRR